MSKTEREAEIRLKQIRFMVDKEDLFIERSDQGYRLYSDGGGREWSPRLPSREMLLFLDGMVAALRLDEQANVR